MSFRYVGLDKEPGQAFSTRRSNRYEDVKDCGLLSEQPTYNPQMTNRDKPIKCKAGKVSDGGTMTEG